MVKWKEKITQCDQLGGGTKRDGHLPSPSFWFKAIEKVWDGLI